MNTHLMYCPSCEGPVIVNLGTFPLNSEPRNKTLHLQCPLCEEEVSVGYVSESYDDTIRREAESVANAARRPSHRNSSPRTSARDSSSSPQPTDHRDEGGGGRGAPRFSNDDRSDSMNPNNPAHQSSGDNRSNQLNPNNSAYHSSRAGR